MRGADKTGKKLSDNINLDFTGIESNPASKLFVNLRFSRIVSKIVLKFIKLFIQFKTLAEQNSDRSHGERVGVFIERAFEST